MNEIEIGSRVLYNLKFKGIVRYIGEVNMTKGILYGVELDTPDGKSNGSISNECYFICKENYGIFVRRSQLSKLVEDAVQLENRNICPDEGPSEIPNHNPRIASEARRHTFIPSLLTYNNTKGNTATNKRVSMSTNVASYNKENQTVKNEKETKKDKRYSFQIKEINDLREQVETLKSLKKQDREKLVAVKETLSKERENLSELTGTIENLKAEKENISRDFDNYRDFMKSVEDEIEMAMIDKEMAELKIEEQQIEIERMREHCQKLIDENNMLKSGPGSDEAKTFIEQSSLVEKYKNGIVELSNVINSLKLENETKISQIAIFQETQAFQELEMKKLQSVNKKLEIDLKEMKDLVDCTADMEIMLDKLTFKNDLLEREIKKLKKALMEFDQKDEETTELLENKNKEIRDLKAEIDEMNQKIYSTQVTLEMKERELGDNLQIKESLVEKINSLMMDIDRLQSEIRSKNELIERSNEFSRKLSIINYQQKSMAQNDVVREIEDKLTKIELDQGKQHVKVLYQYLPQTFSISGGDGDSVTIVLLVNRFIEKISLILDYIIQKKRCLHECDNVDKKSENINILCQLEYLLLIENSILKQIQTNLQNCSQEFLQTISHEYPRLQTHESQIDLLIDRLKRQCIDVSRNFSVIMETVTYFHRFYIEKFRTRLVDCNLKMKGFFSVIGKGADCITQNVVWIKKLLEINSITNSKFEYFIGKLEWISQNLISKVKSVFPFLKQCQNIEFDIDLSLSIDDSIFNFTPIIVSLFHFSLELNDYKITSDDLMSKLMEIFVKFFYKTSSNSDIIDSLCVIDQTTSEIAENFKNGFYDTGKITVQLNCAIDLSATSYRDKILKLQGLSAIIQKKEENLQRVNRNLTVKNEQISLLNLEIDFLKKKFFGSIEAKDHQIQLLNQKLEAFEIDNKEFQTGSSEEMQTGTKLNEVQNDNISLLSSSDSEDKLYYLSTIRNLCDSYRYMINQVAQLKAQKSLLVKLKPLSICQSQNRLDIQIDKIQSMKREVYEDLSLIKIPDISSKEDIKKFSHRKIRSSRMKNNLNELKNDIDKIIFRNPFKI